ncbi:MAG: peptidase M14 [Tannerellaceae bacterium]|nr:peptidase M14 [Tannerellaceae bacterium]
MNHPKISFLCLCLALAGVSRAQVAEDDSQLSYFLPADNNVTYNPNVPTPDAILGFQLGEQHAEWNQVVDYMKTLAQVSNRVRVRETGRTYQHRPFLEVTITSPNNLAQIETIRAEHLRLADVNLSASLPLTRMPVVVSLMYSIHGNEPSGVNASLAVAYYLAAAQGEKIESLLEQTVVTLSPGLNPDGVNRFASWVNSSRSLSNVSDPNSREFSEPWPSSRTNHYWADCNRDWLMTQHPEGISAVETYLHWLPNLVADHHEQGSSRHFYFSPGHAKRTNPFTHQANQDLTAQVSAFCAQELNKIGSFYFSKEGYDDFYYGKGAAYGDIHGSVCLLYEQAATRGHVRDTRHGVRTFAWTIRNQAYASYATILAGYALKDKLLGWQKEFYELSAAEAAKLPVKGYVFDTRGSRTASRQFLQTLSHHQIEVRRLAKDITVDKQSFLAGDAYVIPMNQKFHGMIRTLMENNLSFQDSIFYDISTWTFPHAFNLKYAELKNLSGLLGEKATENTFPPGRLTGGKSEYGYVFACKEFYVYRALNELLRAGLRVSAGSRPFLLKTSGGDVLPMDYGALEIPVKNQLLSADEIHALVSRLAVENGIEIHAVQTGLTDDVDLGSPSFTVLQRPRVAILTGRTMGVADSGELWFLLDKHFGMQPTLIEAGSLTPRMLHRYNVIVMANGVPALSKETEAALKEWVGQGGTLIATGRAYALVKRAGLLSVRTSEEGFREDSTRYRPFAEQAEADAGWDVSGVILNCSLDVTHPIAWGLNQPEIAVMKTGNIFFRKDADPYISPLHYTSQPLLSGFLSAGNERQIKDTPAVFAKPSGNGAVFVFADDVFFRSYYYGTAKLFMNAVFFGECIKRENYSY